jgi:hypothetical protein
LLDIIYFVTTYFISRDTLANDLFIL